jgi:hypothetical protein
VDAAMTLRPGWVRLWGIAVLAHLIGNPRFGALVPDLSAHGIALAALSFLAAGLVIQPESRILLVATNVGVLVVAWFEAPFIGNHWQLAALVSVAMLIALTRQDPWGWFSVTARWMFLGFYTWAAVAKLNSAFFDPAVSCGLVYANQALGSWGLPAIGADSALTWIPIVGSALIELSIPVLLVMPRTRVLGVAVGIVFHGLISLDLAQHFYDFTALLIALLVLFLPRGAGDGLVEKARGEVVRPMSVVAAGLGVLSVLPWGALTTDLVRYGAFVLWIPAFVWITVALARGYDPPDEVGMRLTSSVSVALVVVVVAIGALPYLEVRTATSWNMYANLHTVAGESNHLLIRSTLPLTDHQERIVTIVESDDAGLQLYADHGYGLVERHFLDYLTDRPEARVEYTVGGQSFEATGAEISQPIGWFARKFQLFRAVDLTQPPRCQLLWFPAG